MPCEKILIYKCVDNVFILDFSVYAAISCPSFMEETALEGMEEP
jgi:hypothetical protein